MMKIIFIVLSFFLFSCSDVNEGEGTVEALSDSRIPKCELGGDAFTFILEKNIVGQIDCLYEQLEFFMSLAKEEGEDIITPTSVRKSTLREFVEKKMNSGGKSKAILDNFDLLFRINGAIFGSNDDLLVLEDLEKLKEFMKTFNQKVVSISRLFHSLRPQTVIPYSTHKNNKRMIMDALDFVLNKASYMKDLRDDKGNIIGQEEVDISLLNILKIRTNATPKPIDIASLIRAFTSSKNDNTKLIEDLVSVRFLKPVFLGGDSDSLTRKEFTDFITHKAKPMLDAFYDLYRFKNIAYGSDNLQERYKIYSKHLEQLRDVLIYRTPDEISSKRDDNSREVLHIDRIFDFLKIFGAQLLGESFDIQQVLKYRWEALRLKEIFLKNNKEIFSLNDMKNLIDYFQKMTKTGEAYSELFNLNRELILRGDKITGNSPLKGRYKNKSDPYFVSFSGVLKKYRYFKGKNEIPYYGEKYDRNVEGVIESRVFELVLEKVVEFYERTYPCDGGRLEDTEHYVSSFEVYNSYEGRKERVKIEDGYTCINPAKEGEKYDLSLTGGQIYLVLLEFRRALNEMGIITKGDEYSQISSVMSLADLFSSTATDNQFLEVPELVELVSQLMSATSMKNRLVKEIRKRCDIQGSQAEYYQKEVDNIGSSAEIIDVFNTSEEDLIRRDSKTGFHPALKDAGARYSAKCVRENFYGLLKQGFISSSNERFSYFKFLEKLKKFYVDAGNSSEVEQNRMRVVLLLERFTKTCSQDNVPYSGTDIMGVFAGLFNVESTMARFDYNNDNIIGTKKMSSLGGKSEVDLAFYHFQAGIEKLLPENFRGERVARVVFRYLVKHKRAPTNTQVITGVIGSIFSTKDLPVDRETLTSVIVSLQGSTKEKEKDNAVILGRNFVSRKTQCKSRLPLKERRAPYNQRLNCSTWNYFLPDMKRSDCDYPTSIFAIEEAQTVE